MKEVDKFFKDKLEGHTLAPSENAWSRVESKLSKKNNLIAWRMAAAVLIAGALIGLFIWSQQGSQPENQIAASNNNNDTNKSTPATPEEKPTEIINATPYKKSKVPSIQKKQIQTSKEDETARKVKLVETETALAQQYTIKIQPENLSEEKKEKEQATVQPQVASTKRKPIKLEFTLEDVSSEESVATTNEVKESGLKKVLNLARDVKHGERLATNLREKKDELFAHNFITGKTKNQ